MRIFIAYDLVSISESNNQMLPVRDQVELIGCYNNGSDVLKAIESHQVDLAILDTRMPPMSGSEILSIFKRESANVKIIVLTLNSSEYYHQLALQAGADYSFKKIDFVELSFMIAELSAKNNTNKALTIPGALQQHLN